jgi:hypothetical protein
MHESEVIRKFIFSALRSKTAGEIVIPSRDPAAKVGDRQLIKPVFSKVLVGEHADTLATGTGKPKNQTCITAGRRLDNPGAVACGLEGLPDMLGDLRQWGVVPGGEVQILRRTVQDLMRSKCVTSSQQQAVSLEDGQAIQQ